MTPDELRPILAEYRVRVSAAWSKATAHPDHDAADGSPVGQCGVTSAWLQQRLREDHGISSAFCTGTAFTAGPDNIGDHCWLEIGSGWSRIILDITADQIPGLHQPVCTTFGDLCAFRISYIAEHRISSTEVDSDPILHPRLAILTKALS